MFSCSLDLFFIFTNSCTNAFMPICRNAHSNSAATNQNASYHVPRTTLYVVRCTLYEFVRYQWIIIIGLEFRRKVIKSNFLFC